MQTDIATYTVYDIKGRLLLVFKSDWSKNKGLSGRLTIDRNLPFGIYLCRISAGSVDITGKLVIVM
jgi:hypothetical protein